MTSRKLDDDLRRIDRRSGFNRRWIKSDYEGIDRRSGEDRRQGIKLINPLLLEDLRSNKMVGLEKLLVSNSIQLEAITRLLLAKGIIQEQELLEMMKKVQAEYQSNNKR